MAEEKILITGNEAAGEAAIRAGCRFYYGYPITPQNELTAYMARRMYEVGGTFIQAESEVAAINMVYGSAAAGKRTMTSSSSPGISLKQEGISYIAGSDLPAVIINVQRSGPGLGGIDAAQGDYFQSVKGGGHGDYRLIVLAPASVQEVMDLVQDAFDLADQYRTPVLVLMDAQIGQTMQPAVFRERPPVDLPPKDWALTGAKGRERNIVRSFFIRTERLIQHNEHLQAKYRRIKENEVRFEAVAVDDAQAVLVAYGTPARVCAETVRRAGERGLRVGLIRPITLWPFPSDVIRQTAERGLPIVAVELSAGQMVEDVRLAVEGRSEVGFVGRMGGAVPTPGEVLDEVERVLHA